MKDFMNKVDALVKLWGAAASIGLDITEAVTQKIKGHAVNLMDTNKLTFTVKNNDDYVQMPILNNTEADHCHAKRKLEAVKEYKYRIGGSLMDAKRAIDQYCLNQGIR